MVHNHCTSSTCKYFIFIQVFAMLICIRNLHKKKANYDTVNARYKESMPTAYSGIKDGEPMWKSFFGERWLSWLMVS